jgi:hypothetical protein
MRRRTSDVLQVNALYDQRGRVGRGFPAMTLSQITPMRGEEYFF